LACLAAEPKVDQLNDSFADYYVFKLDVPVSYLAIVQVDQDVKQLLYDRFGLVFGQSPIALSFEVRMQRLARHVLHYEVDVVRVFDCFVELDDIRVIQVRERFDFLHRLPLLMLVL
jgi:hypothetical protein